LTFWPVFRTAHCDVTFGSSGRAPSTSCTKSGSAYRTSGWAFSGATDRVGGLVVKMAPFLESARKRGIQIIHAPSETMPFYQDTPQRKRILALAKVEPPSPLNLFDPPLPIDDKRGGCDTPDQFYKAWTREHPGLRIDASDVISDNGTEIYSFLRERGALAS
jgi:hypothetical protein